MSWDGPALINLGDVLADLYPTREDSYRAVDGAKLKKARIRFNDAAHLNWHGILTYAANQDQIPDVIAFALSEHPKNELLKLAHERGSLDAAKGPDIRTEVEWQGPGSGEQLEQIMGSESTLIDVTFLETGVHRARCVARVKKATANASGFLVHGGLFVTNHHVIPDAATARLATIEFNCQKTMTGEDATIDPYKLDPGRFFITSKKYDYSVIAISGDPEATWGCLDLDEIAVTVGERVNIVQHAGGGPKKVSFVSNKVVFACDDRVQYLTDTLPGSSGAPVFDHRWRVVALHHSGGWLPEPGAKKSAPFYRNQGIHINVVIRAIREARAAKGGPLA